MRRELPLLILAPRSSSFRYRGAIDDRGATLLIILKHITIAVS